MLIPLAPKVWVVAPEVPPRYPYGNCMYIEADYPTLIDLGAGGLAFSTLNPDKVRQAFISHFHFDHIHGHAFFPQADLYVSAIEQITYLDEGEYIRFHGYDLWETFMPGIPREAYGQVVVLPDDVPVKPGFRVFNLKGVFNDLDQLDLGNRQITAVHLPGHTAGHFGFYLEKEGILFSGDIDLVPTGPWYSSNSASVGDLIKSVQRIEEMAPRLIVPSHRRIQDENLYEKLRQYIRVVHERNDRILEILHQPLTLHQLAEYRMVFPNRQNLYELFWEIMSLRNHVKYLIKINAIQEISEGLFVRR
ncbi:MAG: MBL fold metallo-hydrolase [Syntrophomonadaceae bacterium]|nr:MBL fold metallo-hydrolase [Syntrophomonadaceae bacterium]